MPLTSNGGVDHRAGEFAVGGRAPPHPPGRSRWPGERQASARRTPLARSSVSGQGAQAGRPVVRGSRGSGRTRSRTMTPSATIRPGGRSRPPGRRWLTPRPTPTGQAGSGRVGAGDEAGRPGRWWWRAAGDAHDGGGVDEAAAGGGGHGDPLVGRGRGDQEDLVEVAGVGGGDPLVRVGGRRSGVIRPCPGVGQVGGEPLDARTSRVPGRSSRRWACSVAATASTVRSTSVVRMRASNAPRARPPGWPDRP